MFKKCTNFRFNFKCNFLKMMPLNNYYFGELWRHIFIANHSTVFCYMPFERYFGQMQDLSISEIFIDATNDLFDQVSSHIGHFHFTREIALQDIFDY